MTPQEATSIVRRLRAVLEPLGDAIATADLNALLRLEPELAAVMSSTPIPERGGKPHPALRAEIASARATLLRCRRLGAALVAFRRFGLQARGVGSEYDRVGRERGLATVHAFELRG